MSKPAKKGKKHTRAGQISAIPRSQAEFDVVLRLIDAARARAVSTVNAALIDLYWQIGEHLSRKISGDGWGKGRWRRWPSTSSAASRE